MTRPGLAIRWISGIHRTEAGKLEALYAGKLSSLVSRACGA
jgi:hypothetical protein